MTTSPASELKTTLRSAPLSEQAMASIGLWLTDPQFSVFSRDIEALIANRNWQELEDAFYMHVPLGTGGIRGRLGVGPNRINMRTIGEAAQGLSSFIQEYGVDAKRAGVVVGHEARRNSRAFATLCCEVLAANGIRAMLFDGIRSTPELSFSVRYLRATAGVQITASHNPRTDNGFKFYWSDGGQVVAPHDARFMQIVSEVRQIDTIPFPEGERRGLITINPREVDDAYLRAVRSLSLNPSRSATIVFSPIHGAGSTNVLPVLRDEGYQVLPVREQLEPDENFPTAPGDLINPEFREVMELPIRQAEQSDADLAICSDPDADRIGVAAKIAFGNPEVQFLTGNQVGAALLKYILEHRKRQGRLSPRDLVLETAVTTTLTADIARSYEVTVQDDLLVGFKFIAEIIGNMEDPSHFVFAAEESLGYLAGDFVRDKDAAIAALLIAEMASWLKDQGKTIPMFLDDIYRQYGYYKNVQYLIELPGKSGFDMMTAIMQHLQKPPSALAGQPPAATVDRLGRDRTKAGYRLGQTGDMISFWLSPDGRTRVTTRPSGTEPKLKYYIQHYDEVQAGGDLAETKERVDALAHELARSTIDWCTHGIPQALEEEWRTAVSEGLRTV